MVMSVMGEHLSYRVGNRCISWVETHSIPTVVVFGALVVVAVSTTVPRFPR